MELKKKVKKILNEQFNSEYYSSYLYLSMSAYFESQNLSGFSQWMKIQSGEELEHAMKFFDYINERSGRVVLSKIPAPQKQWKSPLDAFQSALAHEKKVTKQIHNIFDLSKKEKDPATEVFIQWFVSEQVEEEDSALKIVEKLKMVKDSKNGLLMLDKPLGKRK